MPLDSLWMTSNALTPTTLRKFQPPIGCSWETCGVILGEGRGSFKVQI